MKLLFLPFSIVAGLAAGQLSKKLFDVVWGRIDDEPPPEPQHRRIEVGKMAMALAIEGALFRLVKGLVDHFARRGFTTLTGSWPGEEAPESS